MRVNRRVRLAIEKAMGLAKSNKKTIEEEIPEAIAKAKDDIIGGAHEDFDTLGEMHEHVTQLENNLKQIMSDYLSYTESMYVPKTGELKENEALNFIRALGLTTENTLIKTLEKLKSGINAVNLVVVVDEVDLPPEITPTTLLSIRLNYPDGRHDEIIHYDLVKIDGSTTYKFKGYNHFNNDLSGKTITVNYTTLNSIQLVRS